MGFLPCTEWLFAHFFEEVVRCCNTISVDQLCLGWSLYADKAVHGVLTKIRLQRIFFPSQRSFATEAFFTDSYVDLHICVPARRPETRAVRFPRWSKIFLDDLKRLCVSWKLALDFSDGGNPGWFLWFAFLASGMLSVETNYQSNKSYILFPTSVWDQI